MAASQALSYRFAKVTAAATAAGGVACGALAWQFVSDKKFRAMVRSDYGQVASHVDRLLGEHAPRTATKMRVVDECDEEDGFRSKAAVAEKLRPKIMPAMPGGILTTMESFSLANALPEVAADDDAAAGSGDASPRLPAAAAWSRRRVEGELADTATVPAPAPRGRPGEDTHATLPGADFQGQLAWLRAKEALAAQHLEAATAAVRENRKQLAGGMLGGGRRLMEREAEARSVRRELRDLAEAKLSVKTHGVMQ